MNESKKPDPAPVKSSDELTSVVLFWCAILGGSLALVGYLLRADFWVAPSLGRVLTDVSDVIYKTMKIFGLGADLSGTDDGSLRFAVSTGILHVARFLAPVALYGTVIRILAGLMRPYLQRRRIAALTGHTVVCGWGDMARQFILNLLRHDPERRYRCVVVADRKLDEARAFCKQFGLELVEGDARVPSVLEKANFRQAERVLGVSDDDSINLEIANGLAGLSARSASQPLEAHIHIGHDTLMRELVARDAFLKPSDILEIRPFNVSALIARRFFRRRNLMADAALRDQTRVHLVFVGFDDVALQIVLQFARICPFGSLGRPLVTVLAADTGMCRATLEASYPELLSGKEAVLEMSFETWEPQSGGFSGALMRTIEDRAAVTAIIVALGNDALNSRTALLLRALSQREARWQAPIYVHLTAAGGLGSFVQSTEETKEFGNVVEPFGNLAAVCHIDDIEGRNDATARLLHEGYRALRGADRGPATMAWEKLAETFRAANRRAADHIPVKLASVGYRVADGPLATQPGRPLKLSDPEMRHLAALEHESWANGQKLAGWRYGPMRDSRRRFHEALRPYEMLSSETQAYDLEQVKLIADRVVQPSANNAPSIFRERRIALVGGEAGVRAQGGALQGVIELLARFEGDWLTLVTALASEGDVLLVEAALEALDASARNQWRVIVVRGVPEGAAQNSGLAARRKAILSRKELDWMIDVFDPGFRLEDWQASAELRSKADETARTYIVRTCGFLLARAAPAEFCEAWLEQHDRDSLSILPVN